MNGALVASIVICSLLALCMLRCCSFCRRNRKKTRAAQRTALAPGVGMVPVGRNYATARALEEGMGAIAEGDEDQASLNGDEHLYADSNPPDEEELREQANVIARAEAEERALQRRNQALVKALLVCAPSVMPKTDGGAKKEECSVCLELVEDTDPYRRLPCKHMFHTECIDEWLGSHVTCPMCNVPLVDTASEADLRAAADVVDNRRGKVAAPGVAAGPAAGAMHAHAPANHLGIMI
mmetsp:Transcript_36724/g.96150  ORF Transcript_36724/g.96150 Transcript_36724/m.96150 type:complete len:238 (+) Transcript_36724:244-957(+)|eukprot:CAMPEP_0182922126 /NCGR_PEP_ID=MMETSP0105_2-20130417/4594_1 /TAXON_ID=81532 ORGANISM="Acanthoeca-like sp., Strain 10tr" /NCGR_SAMPLE_ID=MMETSP0105_2 /ASSEMBLY_ACC=CAM_ASM_000205 /LENGTH=237 /DNA_ID=CAMNT_0025059717 /DNA_START=169 /DNA_END=882 /DNA_ORIENTATION=-